MNKENLMALAVMIKVWEKIPLGIRMHSGGMDREIPKEIIEKLDRLGYTIVKKKPE